MKVNKYLLYSFCALFLFSCAKDDDDSSSGTPSTSGNKYSGSASHGDLITIEIKDSDNSFEIYNETTGESSTGNYEDMSGNDVEGILMFDNGTEKFFTIELDDKVIASTFPSGNAQNDISFGVTSEIDNTGKESLIAGNYVYIRMGDVPINGSSEIKEWGVFTLTADGEIHLGAVASAEGDGSDYSAVAPEDLDSLGFSFPLDTSNADESGTWALNGSKGDRFDVTVGSDPYTGYAFVENETSVFLMDLGTGKGFALGFKVSATSPSDWVGDYLMVETTGDESNANAFNIDNSGLVTVNGTSDGDTFESNTLGTMEFISALGNLAYVDVNGVATLYMVKAGDAAMYFIFNADGTLNSYGAGVQR